MNDYLGKQINLLPVSYIAPTLHMSEYVKETVINTMHDFFSLNALCIPIRTTIIESTDQNISVLRVLPLIFFMPGIVNM